VSRLGCIAIAVSTVCVLPVANETQRTAPRTLLERARAAMGGADKIESLGAAILQGQNRGINRMYQPGNRATPEFIFERIEAICGHLRLSDCS
jgi:hypothetical protein